ncbi:MAG: alkaline phosphatase family protein [Hyphomicrobiales bacterium]|nr:alkaline phosphatase family protein [Hyphomicrobiales bacterium]
MNILFITADQWRGECLSALGHADLKTPNLDRLANDGVLFARHYAQAAPCGPSRASLYTGMYLHNHGVHSNGIPLDSTHTNLALEARRAGYQPALFGYTDIVEDPGSPAPENRAHQYAEQVLPGMDPVAPSGNDWSLWFERLKSKGYAIPKDPKELFRPRPDYPGAVGSGRTYPPALFRAEDSNTAFLVDEIINYLAAGHASPWFVHLSTLSPHPPFIAPEPYHALYEPEAMKLPVRRPTAEQEAGLHPWLQHYLYDQQGAGFTVGADSRDNLLLPELDLRQIKATYFGMISEVDAQIGRLIDFLKQTGAYDNTLIIFTSDHGEYLGDHWMFAKFGYHEQTFHVPLIIRDPAAEARPVDGRIINAFTESIDIMPTILDRIGRPAPAQCDGFSLRAFCRGQEPEDWRREYYAEFDMRSPWGGRNGAPLGLQAEQCMISIIRGSRYKYVHFEGLPCLFFDLEADPEEFHNLIDDRACRQRVAEYARKALARRKPGPSPSPR